MAKALTMALGLTAALSVGTAAGAESCGLCDTSVTTNASLAACFLERFDDYAGRTSPAIVVDLSDCPMDRGVVEALSSPADAGIELDTEFIVTRPQLECLKTRVEDPEIDLDPHATIDLGDCK